MFPFILPMLNICQTCKDSTWLITNEFKLKIPIVIHAHMHKKSTLLINYYYDYTNFLKQKLFNYMYPPSLADHHSWNPLPVMFPLCYNLLETHVWWCSGLASIYQKPMSCHFLALLTFWFQMMHVSKVRTWPNIGFDNDKPHKRRSLLNLANVCFDFSYKIL